MRNPNLFKFGFFIYNFIAIMENQKDKNLDGNKIDKEEQKGIKGGATTNSEPIPCPKGEHRNSDGKCVKDDGNDTHP